ncbi:MAG: hypothetical protein KDE27_32215 [Planctomycetes bacterium]|nr:hypothetical protein [Planctomycetota bacterium]
MSILSGEPAAWGADGPSFFDLAMAIVTDSIAQLDDRRRDRFADRLRRWAAVNPPPATAKLAGPGSHPGDRFVAAITVVGRRAVRSQAKDPDEEQSLFVEGLHMGLARLVKYWGPGKRYPQRCPVRYSIQAVKSACSNAVRRQRREGGGDG